MNEAQWWTWIAVWGCLFTWQITSGHYQRKIDKLLREKWEEQRRRDQEWNRELYKSLSTEEWRVDFQRRHGLPD